MGEETDASAEEGAGNVQLLAGLVETGLPGEPEPDGPSTPPE